MKETIIGMADGYINKVSANAFATVMGQSVRDFGWGSNSTAGNQGVLLIIKIDVNLLFLDSFKKLSNIRLDRKWLV